MANIKLEVVNNKLTLEVEADRPKLMELYRKIHDSVLSDTDSGTPTVVVNAASDYGIYRRLARKPLSETARKKISKGMKKRWAKRKRLTPKR